QAPQQVPTQTVLVTMDKGGPYIHIEQRNMDIDGNNQASGSGKPRNQSGRNVKAKLDPEAQDDEDKEKKRKTSKGPTEKPPIAQMTMPYSIISDLMHTKAEISFEQLMSLPPFKNEVKKAITPRRKRASKEKGEKGKGKAEEANLGESSFRNTPMICKGQ
ncbi:5745_t:CDS:2, partial [Dentiscutata erythropus]